MCEIGRIMCNIVLNIKAGFLTKNMSLILYGVIIIIIIIIIMKTIMIIMIIMIMIMIIILCVK